MDWTQSSSEPRVLNSHSRKPRLFLHSKQVGFKMKVGIFKCDSAVVGVNCDSVVNNAWQFLWDRCSWIFICYDSSPSGIEPIYCAMLSYDLYEWKKLSTHTYIGLMYSEFQPTNLCQAQSAWKALTKQRKTYCCCLMEQWTIYWALTV